MSRVFWKIEGDLKKKFQNCFTILSGELDGCSMVVSILSGELDGCSMVVSMVFNPISYGLSESVAPMEPQRPPSDIKEVAISDPMLR